MAGMRSSGRVTVWSWSMTMPGSSWPVTIGGPGSQLSTTDLGKAFVVNGWTFPRMTRQARSPEAPGAGSGRVGMGGIQGLPVIASRITVTMSVLQGTSHHDQDNHAAIKSTRWAQP